MSGSLRGLSALAAAVKHSGAVGVSASSASVFRTMPVAALLTSVLTAIYHVAKIGVRIALSRITVITVFCAGVGATILGFFSALNDSSSFVSNSLSKVEGAAQIAGEFVSTNEFFSLVVYSLSLDVLLDGLLGSFIWVFCTLGSALLVATVSVFISALPLISDMVISGLRHQILSKWTP